MIGSSLLFVHDRNQACIWLIDFAKTVSLPSGANITHINEWSVGNHEDGYLIGINNLIQLFEELLASEIAAPQNQSIQNSVAAIEASSNRVDCTSEQQFESTEMQIQENNLDLPHEIDAMKIDQSMQQFDRE